jgi:hypothetical protein
MCAYDAAWLRRLFVLLAHTDEHACGVFGVLYPLRLTVLAPETEYVLQTQQLGKRQERASSVCRASCEGSARSVSRETSARSERRERTRVEEEGREKGYDGLVKGASRSRQARRGCGLGRRCGGRGR